MGVSVNTCDKCTNFSDCHKYCGVKIGENIVNFVSGAETIRCKIGEFRKDSSGKLNYVITGFASETSDFSNPIDILVPLSDMCSQIKPKLESTIDVNPKQALDQYIAYMQFTKTIRDKAMDDFRLFNSNVILPTVVRPGAEVEIKFKGFDNKTHKKITNIKMVKWMLNKKTGILEAFFIAAVGRDDTGNTHSKFLLSEYGDTWTLPSLEVGLKSAEVKHKAVKMNNLGLVAPLEVTDDNVTVAADGQHTYLNGPAGIIILGSFIGNTLKEDSRYTKGVADTPAMKELRASLPFLFRHRKFILPYCMSKPNRIEV